ncbi:carbohydrate-binding module family 13 protein [Rhizophagus irregularis DAOM 181602=DAOM 197198]|nr:carbohydrate-binding module family 13 protein [Rhizophagus irregularis DAOM 181602=DAOM 197198]
MSKQFFSSLSQNYIEILKDDEYYDITIEVGEDPNVKIFKIFRAHMIILCYRSPFLRRTLASNKKNDSHVYAHIKLSNISPETFQIILKYIYGGIISLNEQEPSETLKILSAADKLHLQELVDYLQQYLIENKVEWMEQHFELTHRTSFHSSFLLELQKFCIDFMAKSPEKVFKSLDFISLPEESLVSLIKRDDLQMKEVEVWDHVLKWGLEKNPALLPDPTTCKPNDNILLPRYKNIDGIIDSKIVNLNNIALISRWIDKIVIKSKFSYAREFYLPYKFKLLLRKSRDGFTPNEFHRLCDNKFCTITLIKVKGTEEIIGGYNPSVWKSAGDCSKAKDSFIFSFKNKNSFKDPILSYVKDYNKALFYRSSHGPTFFTDLGIYAKNGHVNRNYDFIQNKQQSYEKKMRDTGDEFLIDDYEVFQILKRDH